MTALNPASDTPVVPGPASAAGPIALPAPPSWSWRRGALILVCAAQLITISALLSTSPLPTTWYSLLLAIAPALLVAAAAFAPAPVNRVAAVAALAAMIAGLAGGFLHTGLFFGPAVVVLAIGTAKLWREQS
jgi:hypothetical protein